MYRETRKSRGSRCSPVLVVVAVDQDQEPEGRTLFVLMVRSNPPDGPVFLPGSGLPGLLAELILARIRADDDDDQVDQVDHIPRSSFGAIKW